MLNYDQCNLMIESSPRKELCFICEVRQEDRK